MRTEKEIITQLHTLQAIKPSQGLQKRIALLGSPLPGQIRTGFTSSIFFRPALALASILLLVGLSGSSLVLSANQSKPGSLLFPVKKAVVETQLHFTSDPIQKQKLQEEILLVTPVVQKPSVTPTPTKTSEQKKENRQEKKDVEGAQFIPTPTFVQQYTNGQNKFREKYQSGQHISSRGSTQRSLHFMLFGHQF
jgi:hypothetical protein